MAGIAKDQCYQKMGHAVSWNFIFYSGEDDHQIQILEWSKKTQRSLLK